MDISTVQKRKFLKNLNKLYYSKGTKPSPQEIRNAYDAYFNVNKFGQPLDIAYEDLEAVDMIDPFMLNELMANSLLNLEVLYDCIYQNNSEIFETITILNKKMEALRKKRAKLEDRIDQILFENANSDGYFYSYSDQFTDLSKVDLSLTSAHVDLINKKVELPYITSDYSTSITRNRLIPNSVSYSVVVNGENTIQDRDIEDPSSMFDGLNDTYWIEKVALAKQSVVTLTLQIPLTGSAAQVSRIDGTLLTASPCSIYLRCVSANPDKEDQIFSKSSDSDYDSFSFRFDSDLYSSATLTLVKVEPDEVVDSESSPYVYQFGIRELIIGARYYEPNANLISMPVSISTDDNELLDISTVAIEVDDEVPSETTIKYYVAADVNQSDDLKISSFDWKEIEPVNRNVKENLKFVSLSSSRLRSKKIGGSNPDLDLIPIVTSSESNINSELNPFTVPYSSISAYRICFLNSEESVISPYILSGVGNFQHYGLVHSNGKVDATYYKDPTYWSDLVANSPGQVISSRLEGQISSTTTPIQNPSSGLFKTKLLCDEPISVTHTVVKENYDYNLSIYLNNALIADLPSGTISSSIEWDFVVGTNTIEIYYDKALSTSTGFNLMSGSSLEQYGTVFIEYYNYVDPIEFRRKALGASALFTIDNIFGQRQLISNRYIDSGSTLNYFTDKNDNVTSVRYRVSMRRYSDPLQTPALNSIKVRFRNS